MNILKSIANAILQAISDDVKSKDEAYKRGDHTVRSTKSEQIFLNLTEANRIDRQENPTAKNQNQNLPEEVRNLPQDIQDLWETTSPEVREYYLKSMRERAAWDANRAKKK